MTKEEIEKQQADNLAKAQEAQAKRKRADDGAQRSAWASAKFIWR